MAQYDLILVRNDSGAGTEFTEVVVAKPAASGKFFTQNSSTGAFSWSDVDWSVITGKPATFTPSTHSHAISDITGLQTALDGKQPIDADLTAIAAIAATSGLLKKTAANTWTLDTNTYITGNQTITVTGDVSGSGTTALSLTLANSGVTAGTYNNSATQNTPLTVDAKGRITGTGSAVTITPAWSSITGRPTTIAGYAITDAYTKTEVDTLLQGLKPKPSVKAATTANITLSGAQTIDGVSLVAGDRVLVKDQSTGSTNGIYVVSASTWSRATDADTAAEITSAFVFVEQGSTNADTAWVLSTDNIVLGTTSLVWVKFAGAGAYQALSAILNSIAALSTSATGLVKLTNGVASIDPSNYVTSSGVTSVGGTAPIVSSGGNTPVISINAATTSTAGSMSAADKTKLDGIAAGATANTGTVTSIIAGNGLSGGTITTSGTISLAAVGTAGTYTKVTTNAYGQVTSFASLAESDIPSLSISKTTGLQTALDSKLAWYSTLPSSATASGTAGQIYYSSNFLYVCVAANTWKRMPLSTWSGGAQ